MDAPLTEDDVRRIVREELARFNPSWAPPPARRAAKAMAHRAQSEGLELVPVGAVSAEDIMNGRSPRGSWTKATLAGWGVPWPPPHGWRARLTGAA